MTEERVQRRLAAIMAADVVGYSRLMGLDETKTRARFNDQIDVAVRPAIERHRGRLVKTMGDGILVEFGSVVDAVQCAADIQNAVALHQSCEPNDRRMLFRVGVHLGDVIVEDDDIHGDGVNIAARLEGLAEPGGICISDMAHAGVRNKLSMDFEDLGEQSLKNIAEPVQVFRVQLGAVVSRDAKNSDAVFHRPAVAVLPFENLSGDAEQEYFADGLTEDIITALSLWRSFPVIARNSTFAYKGASPDVRKVAEELGARYVIEGSVRRAGNRLRVTVQLINAATGHHVWAERFDRDLADMFDLQDELTEQIAATVAPEVELVERRRAIRIRPRDLNAWEFVQRGMALIDELTIDGNERGREMFRHALELVPDYADTYIGIALSNIRDLSSVGVTDPAAVKTQALAAARKAVAADRYNAGTHLVLGIALLVSGQYDEATEEMRLVIELNANSATGHISLGHLLVLSGRPEEAMAHLEKGLALNPKDPRNYLSYGFMARACLSVRRYEEAEQWARRAIRWNDDAAMARKLLISALGHLGRIDDARAELEALNRARPDYMANPDNWHRYKLAEDREHFRDGLRRAGWEG